MTNLKFIKTLTAGVVLSLALYPQAFAASSGDNCGTNCSWTLDDDGLLNMFPTDSTKPASMNNLSNGTPWVDKASVKYVNMAYGFTSIPDNAFHTCKNLTGINIPDSVTSLGVYAFERTNIKNLTIPTSVTFVSRNIFMFALSTETTTVSAENVDRINFAPHHDHDPVSFGTVICQGCTPEQAQSLENRLNLVDATHSSTQIRETDSQGNIVIKDIYGAYIGGFDKEGNRIDFDSNGNVIARYDENNNIISSYLYNSDGSIEIYDANGKLTGLKNARSITPAQAAALVKKGNHNRVTLTFK